VKKESDMVERMALPLSSGMWLFSGRPLRMKGT